MLVMDVRAGYLLAGCVARVGDRELVACEEDADLALLAPKIVSPLVIGTITPAVSRSAGMAAHVRSSRQGGWGDESPPLAVRLPRESIAWAVR